MTGDATGDAVTEGEAAGDAAFAFRVAEAAGQALIATRADAVARGLQGAEIKDLGDSSAQALIAGMLAEERPGDAVLSEEAADDSDRLNSERVWIIDPLDGTREYSEGRADWAVHVALWERGELTVGAVAIPGEGLVLSSAEVSGLPERAAGPIRIAVSRSRPPEIVNAVATALGAELVPMGSAGVKICAVLLGTVDAYVHGGGQYEWDSAAPVAIARAAGAHTSRLDGSPLLYNRENPYLPDLVVCRPEFAASVMDAISSSMPSEGTP